MQPPLDDIAVRHLARVVASSDDAIVSKDLNGIIRSWNHAAERMFGYTAAEAVGQSIRMIIPADRQGEEDMVLGRIRAGEGLTHFDTIRQRKDGTLIPISLTVSPIHDDAGRVIGASKIARDITDRMKAAVTARQLAAVVESSDDAIVTKDLTSIITSWNAAAERMFGYTAAEAIGQSVRILIPDELQSEEDTVLAKIRAGDKVDHYETIRQHKDGTRLSVSLTVSPIRNDKGVIIGASKVARDITERACGKHREARRGRRRRGIHARSGSHPSESDRHRNGTHPRGVRGLLLQRDRSRVRRRVHAVHTVGRVA
jgi:PAS domain S-box-containing protein